MKWAFLIFVGLYVVALFLLAVGTFGWFGQERDPLSAIRRVPDATGAAMEPDRRPARPCRAMARHRRTGNQCGNPFLALETLTAL